MTYRRQLLCQGIIAVSIMAFSYYIHGYPIPAVLGLMLLVLIFMLNLEIAR